MPTRTMTTTADATAMHRTWRTALFTCILAVGMMTAEAAVPPAPADPAAPAAAPAEAPAAAPAAELDPTDVLVELGDATITRADFEREFQVAARTTALQQGIEPTADVLEGFAAFRPMLLEQLATQLVLVEHAQTTGVVADQADVDEVVDEIRAAQVDEEGFLSYLERTGFGDEEMLRTVVQRSMSVQNVIAMLSADIEVTDAEVDAWYEANPEMVQTPDGPLPLETIRPEIRELLVQERVEERVQELVSQAPLEIHADRL